MPGRKAPHETRREEILRAAYDVAARHGVESLTLRAVAERATVSHGTVLFHFKRRDELVTELLERILYATAVLRTPEHVDRLPRPLDQLQALLRTEMERLSAEPRHFRLLLEYWTLGVRRAAIRRRISAALDAYRGGFRSLAGMVLEPRLVSRRRPGTYLSADGLAAVAVSLVHGCALQAVINPAGFDVSQHVETAAEMLERLATP